MKKVFKLKNKKIKINIRKNLLSFLNPTSPGTKYYDPPPERLVNRFEKGRILLQIHQFFDLMESINYNLKNKKLLDLGTGNGLVPRLILNFSKLHSCDGTDPFYDGEHKTSWQKHDRDKLFLDMKKYLIRNNLKLDIKKYFKDLAQEDFSFLPRKITLLKNKEKKMKFYSYGASDLNKIKKKYDLIYCKALEHISDLPLTVKNLVSVSKKGTLIYFKHRSFFSYLGPHRYASTGIPWGHVIMNNNEYKRYVSNFHSKRKKEMIDFYFSGISFPRFTVNEIIDQFLKSNYELVIKLNESARYNKSVSNKLGLVRKNWGSIKKNYPTLGLEEISSGIIHLIFRKIK